MRLTQVAFCRVKLSTYITAQSPIGSGTPPAGQPLAHPVRTSHTGFSACAAHRVGVWAVLTRRRRLGGVTSEVPAAGPPPRGLGSAVARYGLARAGLVAVITVLLVLAKVPVLAALPVALVVAFPLSWLLLKPLRQDLNLALADAGRRRRAQKARLRAQLRGEDLGSNPDSSGQHGEGQADGGAERPGQHDHGGVAEHRDQRPAFDPAEHPPNR